MRSLGNLLKAVFKLAMWAVTLAALLQLFFTDMIEVPHNGMAPTLVFGERVLVWRRAKPDMGDPVVCAHPTKPNTWVMGRVVAFAGHSIDSDGRNGLIVDEDRATVEWVGPVRFFDVTREKLFNMRLGTIDYARKHRHEFFVEEGTNFPMRRYDVDKGIYLLGDNRTDDWNDSREFGEVDPANCRGEIFLRLTPGAGRDDDLHHGYLDYIQ